ncbi:hypothetical protein B5X24_HaOG214676 [Helicoverpa armigera]|uniref:DUF5009 domain-containing protein n=1 Tax=Helicoverpa armigera TaxID=29058 RepID=A0A2W1BGT7_HELAM|nr:hypothetical protein B5X24_HaOG214676 [Helicoverpa armigera]
MLAYNHARARIMRWVFWSIIFGVSGGALCMFSKNGGPIPVNKNLWSVSYCLVTSSLALAIQAALYFIVDLKTNNLWSVSYCLVTSSLALAIQAALYFIVDLKTKWGGRPLYYAGQNALFLYIGSELLKRNFPLHWALSAPTHAQLLATHAAAMLIWLAVGVALHRKRIFITL